MGQNDDRLPWTAAKYFMFAAVRIISKMQHHFYKGDVNLCVMSSRTILHSGRINRRDSKWDGTWTFHAMKIFRSRTRIHWIETNNNNNDKQNETQRNNTTTKNQSKSDERKLYTHLSKIILKGACALIMSSTNIYYYKCVLMAMAMDRPIKPLLNSVAIHRVILLN